jgi:hypothetical protein
VAGAIERRQDVGYKEHHDHDRKEDTKGAQVNGFWFEKSQQKEAFAAESIGLSA